MCKNDAFYNPVIGQLDVQMFIIFFVSIFILHIKTQLQNTLFIKVTTYANIYLIYLQAIFIIKINVNSELCLDNLPPWFYPSFFTIVYLFYVLVACKSVEMMFNTNYNIADHFITANAKPSVTRSKINKILMLTVTVFKIIYVTLFIVTPIIYSLICDQGNC
jgi:hypothetical protein